MIDLHRHLSGQRFEDELAANEIDFAGSELSRSMLADALKQLSTCRQLLLELTTVFRRLGSENIGEPDDYAYLQKLLDSALGKSLRWPETSHCGLTMGCVLCIVQPAPAKNSTICHLTLTKRTALRRVGVQEPASGQEESKSKRAKTS